MRKIVAFFSVFIILFISACTENVEIISYKVDYTKTGDIVANQSQWNDFLVRIDFSDGTYVEFFLNESLIDIDDRNKLNTTGKHNINLIYQQVSLKFEIEVFKISYETQLRQLYQMSIEADAFVGTYEEWFESIKGPTGEDGREVLFQVSEGYIQWQYEGETTWTNLIALDTLVGASGNDGENGIDGREVLFQVSEGYIQWQYEGETTWTNLIKVSDLLGQAGNDGQTPYIGENGNWWIGNEDLGVFAGYVDLGIQPTGEFEFAINSDGQSYYVVSYNGNDKVVSIPNNYQGYPVTGIGEGAFENNSRLEKVFIPSNVITVDSRAFYDCQNLKDIAFDINSSLKTIAEYAFYNTGLINLEIPEGVTNIGQYAFYSASDLVNLAIPGSVTHIDQYAFAYNGSLTSLIIPEGVTNIGEYAFRNLSNLESLTIAGSVTSIGRSAFVFCSSLTNLTILGETTRFNNSWNSIGFPSELIPIS